MSQSIDTGRRRWLLASAAGAAAALAGCGGGLDDDVRLRAVNATADVSAIDVDYNDWSFAQDVRQGGEASRYDERGLLVIGGFGEFEVFRTSNSRRLYNVARSLPQADSASVVVMGFGTDLRLRLIDEDADRPTDNTSLRFDAADDSFNMLGINTALPTDQRVQINDLVAVYNLGIAGANAYAGNNTATVSAVAVSPSSASETQISLSPTLQFPLESPSRRFHVIPNEERVVSYICSGGRLYRNANYGYATSCPAPTVGTTPIIAGEATCNFAYDATDMRNGLAKLSLTFSSAGESVSIYHEVHVNNTP